MCIRDRSQTNRKRSVLLRCGRFGVRRPSTLTCCRRIRFSASSVALALKREARIPRISLNKSVIRMRAYAVRLLRLRQIEFSVHTTTIPIVFETAGDPVTLGLVASLNRPGGNLTGVTNLNVEVGQKKLELLRELLPAATVVAVLVDPSAPAVTEQFLSNLQAAAPALGMQLHVLHASTDRDLDTVFATL